MAGGEQKIAAIIVAYNEAATITGVVRPIVQSALFHEVMVISDGSTDETCARAREAGATVVHELPVKSGKGAAVLYGVAHTDAAILFFSDADLYGLRKEHLEAIVRPVVDGKKVMNVGMRDRGPFLTWLASHMPLIGGERALLRQVIEDIPPKFLQGYMLEAAISYHCRIDRLPYGTVPCPGLTIRRKMQKVGFWRGLVGYVVMVYQIVKSMAFIRLAHFRGKFR